MLARVSLTASLVALAWATDSSAQSAATPTSGASAPTVAASIRQPQAVLDEYRIGSQDLLEVTVYGQAELTRTVRVNSQGNISLPLIGQLMAVGLTAIQLERLIADRLSERYLQDPQVTVFVKEAISSRFTIEGAVGRPGVFPIQGPMTLLRAIALAGGQGNLGDLSAVKVFRMLPNGEQQTLTFDVEKIRTGEAEDPRIMNDDLIVVNRSRTRAALRDSLFSDIMSVFNPFVYLK